MGDLATLTVYGDRLSQIARNPQAFVRQLALAFNSGKTATILGQTKVQARRHSSDPAIYMQVGNSCFIMNPYDPETLEIMARRDTTFFGEMLDYMEQNSRELREAYEAAKTRNA